MILQGVKLFTLRGVCKKYSIKEIKSVVCPHCTYLYPLFIQGWLPNVYNFTPVVGCYNTK